MPLDQPNEIASVTITVTFTCVAEIEPMTSVVETRIASKIEENHRASRLSLKTGTLKHSPHRVSFGRTSTVKQREEAPVSGVS